MKYYAPARYLCGLTETDWTPDFTTVQDFAELLGEDGVRLINEAVVTQAVALGLADPKVVVADMTAQEAAIPHPNEMGLLSGFVRSIEAAAGTRRRRSKTRWSRRWRTSSKESIVRGAIAYTFVRNVVVPSSADLRVGREST